MTSQEEYLDSLLRNMEKGLTGPDVSPREPEDVSDAKQDEPVTDDASVEGTLPDESFADEAQAESIVSEAPSFEESSGALFTGASEVLSGPPSTVSFAVSFAVSSAVLSAVLSDAVSSGAELSGAVATPSATR